MENNKIMEQTQSLLRVSMDDMNTKLSDLQGKAEEANEFVLSAINAYEKSVKSLEIAMETLTRKCESDHESLKVLCNTTEGQLVAIDCNSRKSSFVIRNFPEEECKIGEEVVKTPGEAVSVIAHALGLGEHLSEVRESFRLGKVRQTKGRRLIMVRATESTAKAFLKKARMLKQCGSLLNRVYLHEDLPPMISKRLAEMRKRAYEHRSNHPNEEAYVKDKKLFINGVVVDQISQNF